MVVCHIVIKYFIVSVTLCQFLLRDAMLVRHMLLSCVHLSSNPSVHPSVYLLLQVSILLKWLNIGSCKQCYEIAQAL